MKNNNNYVLLIFCLFRLFLSPALVAQVTTTPTGLTIENSGTNAYSLEILHPARTLKVNKFSHLLLQNNFSGTLGDDVWHFGSRDNGDLDIAFGAPSVDGLVSINDALLTFKQDGKIGIGTADPDELLSVSGDIGLSAPSSRINFYDASSIQATLKYNASALELENNTSGGDIILDADDEIKFGTGAGSPTRMNISSTGDVGIGTTTTSAQLEIWDNSNGDHPHLELYETGSGDFARMRFRTLPSSLNHFTIASDPGSNGKMNFFFYDSAEDFGSNILTIEGNDKRVGVNKTNPDADLHISQNSNNNTSTGIRFEDNDGTFWNVWVDNADDFLFNEEGDARAEIETGTGNYNNGSDRKLKENIRPLESVLNRVLELKPSWYNYRSDKKKQITLGFIAQDVEQQFPDFVKKMGDYKALTYDYFGVLAIKAIQELKAEVDDKDEKMEGVLSTNEELRSTNAALQKEVDALESRLAKIEAFLQQSTSSSSVSNSFITLTDAALEQNQPNPFTETTMIQYFIPETVRTAELQITNVEGKLIQSLPVKSRGKGQTTLEAQSLSAGTYFYTLILDGKPLETKRMVLTKN